MFVLVGFFVFVFLFESSCPLTKVFLLTLLIPYSSLFEPYCCCWCLFYLVESRDVCFVEDLI